MREKGEVGKTGGERWEEQEREQRGGKGKRDISSLLIDSYNSPISPLRWWTRCKLDGQDFFQSCLCPSTSIVHVPGHA